jgi:hypothetical protein
MEAHRHAGRVCVLDRDSADKPALLGHSEHVGILEPPRQFGYPHGVGAAVEVEQ